MLTLQGLRACSRLSLGRDFLGSFAPNTDQVRMFGKILPNRIGIAAGYDKNAIALEGLYALGFGHIEVGTVTPKPQLPNPKPRLKRMKAYGGLINSMGFPNDGAFVVLSRVKAFIARYPNAVIGVNVGKNRETSNENAWKDYLGCFELFAPYVDYVVLNVSSPNTKDLRQLQSKEKLVRILELIKSRRSETPVYVKLAPDMSEATRNEILDDLVSFDVGVILSNTRLIDSGGLSGFPLRYKTLKMIQNARKRHPTLKIIASGGIGFDGDLPTFLEAGADLIQIWTSLIYRGPGLMKRL